MRVILTQSLAEKEYSDFESRKPCDFFYGVSQKLTVKTLAIAAWLHLSV